MNQHDIIRCPSCHCYRDIGTECQNPCCQPTLKEKQMGGEWFEWEDRYWVNTRRNIHMYLRHYQSASQDGFVVDLNHGLVSRDWEIRKGFETQEEALAFARDFMQKNGGIIE